MGSPRIHKVSKLPKRPSRVSKFDMAGAGAPSHGLGMHREKPWTLMSHHRCNDQSAPELVVRIVGSQVPLELLNRAAAAV